MSISDSWSGQSATGLLFVHHSVPCAFLCSLLLLVPRGDLLISTFDQWFVFSPTMARRVTEHQIWTLVALLTLQLHSSVVNI